MDNHKLLVLLFFTGFNKVFSNISEHSMGDDIQQTLLYDIAASPEENKNYIYVDYNINIPCTFMSCEKYALPGLNNVLKSRGQQRIFNDGIESDQYHNDQVLGNNKILNGGRSDQDVFVYTLSPDFKQNFETIELIRKYNKKCYIVIISPNDINFNIWKKHILSKPLFNIYLMKPVREGKMYLMYNVCAYCKSGKHAITFDNIWEYQKGFRKSLSLIKSFHGNFNGAKLKVGLQKNFPPSIFMTGVTNVGMPIYAGSDYWTLKFLSKYSNFKMDLIENNDGTACNTKNSVFTGFCQLLIEGKVDIAGFPVAITWTNFQYFDFTSVIYQAYQVLVSANPPMKQQWDAVFKALNPAVLISILISSICVIIVYWVLLKYLTDEEPSVIKVIFVILSVLSNESTNINVSKVSGQVVIGVWMVGCFFVISGVFGEITSVTAQPGLSRKPIDTTEDLINNQMSWITSPLFVLDVEIKRALSGTGLYKKSKKLIVTEGLEYVLQHPLEYVYFYPLVAILPTVRVYFWNGQGQSPFHVSPGVGSPFYMTIFLAKDAPFRDDISKGMLQIDASGLLIHKFIPGATEALGKFSKLEPPQESNKIRFFTVDKLIPSGFVMGFGFIFSILVFTGECLAKTIINKISKIPIGEPKIHMSQIL